MKYSIYYLSIIILFFFIVGCINERTLAERVEDFPRTNHDLSYISFNENKDDIDFVICDSTKMGSGRSRVMYTDGLEGLTRDLTSSYKSDESFNSFRGFIVIRFLMNCHGETGRYRAESIDLDFSPLIAPEGMVENVLELVKGLENWSVSNNSKGNEYSKYVNIKFEDGKIQNVIM